MYSSATIIQTLARKYNARSEFLRTRAAVVDIQAHYKAEVMAREFDMKTRAVKMIHDQIKTHVMRKRWIRRREVARVTTHQIRANRSKERWKHVRKGLYVVHWIARGFLLRCHLLRYMEAIKTLQRSVRRFLVRNRHKWHKVVSALTIQALWRGYRIRQMRPDVVQYLRQKKYERTRSNAIRRLFATFRCDMVRRRFLDIKRSMATLQVTATASDAKTLFSRLRHCAVRGISFLIPHSVILLPLECYENSKHQRSNTGTHAKPVENESCDENTLRYEIERDDTERAAENQDVERT